MTSHKRLDIYLTGKQIMNSKPTPEQSTAAKLLGAKGGHARAKKYSKEQLKQWASLGGKAKRRQK